MCSSFPKTRPFEIETPLENLVQSSDASRHLLPLLLPTHSLMLEAKLDQAATLKRLLDGQYTSYHLFQV